MGLRIANLVSAAAFLSSVTAWAQFQSLSFWKQPPNVSFSTGWGQTCAIGSDYTFKCWGRNVEGQLGTGNTTQRLTPTAISGSNSPIQSSSGTDFTCGIFGAAASCWGNNNYGQIGDGTTVNKNTPTQVSGLTTNVSSVAGGGYHACAVVNGGAKCWGNNQWGQLGTGATSLATYWSDDFNDNSMDTSKWKYSTEHDGYTSSITVLEQNSRLEISPVINNGFTYNGYTAITPMNFAGKAVSTQIVQTPSASGGAEMALGMIYDKDNYYEVLLGWGVITFRDRINGTDTGVSLTFDSTNHKYVRIRHDRATDTINWDTSPDASTWTNQRSIARNLPLWPMRPRLKGGTYENEATTGTAIFDNFKSYTDIVDSLTPAQVSGLTSSVTAIASGLYHSCALVSGAVKCWGFNRYGQLGDGTTIDRVTPVTVSGLTAGVTAIAAANHHSCAILAGAAKCWGFNGDGQLGDGTTVNKSTPVQVSGLTSNVSAIVTGGNAAAQAIDGGFSCAIVSGAAKCWGSNYSGQLGKGSSNATVADNFNDNSRNTGLWNLDVSSAYAFPTETNQRLELTLPGGHGTPYGGYTSVSNYNLTGKQIIFEVVQAYDNTDANYGADAHVSLEVDTNNILAIFFAYQIAFRQLVGGDYSTSDGYLTFDPVMHRFLRIRHDTGSDTINFDTSPDGVVWTNRRSVARGITITSLNMTVYGGCWDNCPNPGNPIIDNIRIEPSRDISTTPTAVSGLTSNVMSISAGAAHACALTSSWTRKCWGSNAFGQIGNNGTVDSLTPTNVTTQSTSSGSLW